MRPLRDLLDTLITGRDPAPAARSRWAALLPVGAVVAAALLAWASVASGAQLTGPWAVVVAAAGAAPLAVVVRWPLLAWRLAWLAALGVGLADLPPVADWWPWQPVQVIVLLVVLFVVGLRRRLGILVWVAGFTAALPLAFVIPGNRIGAMLLLLLPLLVGGLIQAWYVAQRSLADERERGAVLTERARIARELHDVVAHHMSLIAVRTESAPYRLGEVGEPVKQEFGEISAAAREALTEMRRLLGVLRDGEAAPTAPQPGLDDLPELIAAARSAGSSLSVEIEGELTGLPAAVDVSAYRIVQEGLANAARHASGAVVRLAVRRTDKDVLVRVTNDAPATGAPAASDGAGHGLRGMRERVAMLGGELSAAPRPDGGFEVRATLPTKAPPAGESA